MSKQQQLPGGQNLPIRPEELNILSVTIPFGKTIAWRTCCCGLFDEELKLVRMRGKQYLTLYRFQAATYDHRVG